MQVHYINNPTKHTEAVFD